MGSTDLRTDHASKRRKEQMFTQKLSTSKIFTILFAALIMLGTGAQASKANIASEDNAKSASNITLYGMVEYNDVPDVQSFQEQILRDSAISCETKKAIDRLIRVADQDGLRHVVWHRMINQELVWVPQRDLSHVEAIAQACNMPL